MYGRKTSVSDIISSVSPTSANPAQTARMINPRACCPIAKKWTDPTEQEDVLRAALKLAFEDSLIPKREKRRGRRRVRVELLWEECEGDRWVRVCPTPTGRFWDGNTPLQRRRCYYLSSCRVQGKNTFIRNRRVFKSVDPVEDIVFDR